MKIAEIEENVRQLLLKPNKKKFLSGLLLAYGKPNASIKRLEAEGTGSYNLSKEDGVVLWKKQVLYTATTAKDLEAVVDELFETEGAEKHSPRFVIATNFDHIYAVDTKTDETLDIPFLELQKNFDFFLPWAGMEKAVGVTDNPADVKAAEKMAKLFDLIKVDNPANDPKSIHSLNVFLSRLLFCFFAEDTGIFTDKLFSNSVESHTTKDGSDLQEYLQRLFLVLNTEDRKKYPAYLQAFPYVNGGLFAEAHPVPKFSAKSRAILIECGADLNWSEINPDIFGSMIQAVVDVEQRGNMGMHYTSVSNIMKVIEPLFLNDLYEEYEKGKASARKLQELLARIRSIKIFDPACGSGNFLIIAYKELRKLEMEIFNQLAVVNKQAELGITGVQLTQFYGIELDDFAHEVAILAMWLAEHQMNLVYVKRFGKFMPTLPLKPSGKIVCDNATRTHWESICPHVKGSEVFVLGNPPYLGSRVQDANQKEDMRHAFSGLETFQDLDYVSSWFIKAARYIRENDRYAFVTTTSVTQGSQVTRLWPKLFDLGQEIFFAHTGFKWSNNAKNKAAVICAIVGLRYVSNSPKYIFTGEAKQSVTSINAYLATDNETLVKGRSKPISKIPKMTAGNYTGKAQDLCLTDPDKRELISEYPNANKFLKRLVGSSELIKGITRWCLWIADADLEEAEEIPPILRRIKAVKAARLKSDDKEANKLASRPHQFRDTNETVRQSIVVPIVSSERRAYIPIGFIDKKTIVTNKAMVVYEAPPFIFGVITSMMHMVWVKAVAGRLKSDISYSNLICYNTFPVPDLSEKQKTEIGDYSHKIAMQRENFSELNLAYLYDPDKMPAGLLKAHQELDEVVDRCYRTKPFLNNEDRLQHLYKLYADMLKKEPAGD